MAGVCGVTLPGRSLCGHRHLPAQLEPHFPLILSPGQLGERGDRKELLLFIVPSSAGSDNNSFLPHVSGLAVRPMGQGCSHSATAQCSEGMMIWDWH